MMLYLWQLPQNLLGLLVIAFIGAEYSSGYDAWETRKYSFGVSLGRYIIFGKYFTYTSLKHERGHQKQSLYLGPLYLLIIGLPSLVGNLLHRVWKFDYYKLPWEAWADYLGGVKRNVSL